MADSSVDVTAGTGTSIDTRTEATNGNHRQVIVIGDPSTNAGVAPVDAAAGLKVDLGADNDVVIGAAATSIGKAEDAASASADVGVPAMAIQKATPANTADTDGDYEMLQMSAGRLWVSAVVTAAASSIGKAEDVASANADVGVPAMAVRKATPANTSDTDGDYEMLQVSAGRLWVSGQAYGDVAHDAADSGNPVKIGAKATNSIEGLTQVASGDRTDLIADLNGALVVRPYTTPEEILSERVSDTGGTSTAFSTFGAGGAGVRNFVTTIVVYNASATAGYVDIRDGAAGSVLMTIPIPAGGGAVVSLPVPLKSSANTALAYDVSAALSTVYISLVGYQAKA